MILIISNSRNEPSTDAVIDWLIYHNASFVRLNTDDLVKKDSYNAITLPDQDLLTVSGRKIDINDINVVWYRRWHDYTDISFKTTNANERKLFREILVESDNVMYYLCGRLKTKKWLSNPLVTRYHNKLHALYAAHKNGLHIPPTLVTSQKAELKKFISKYTDVITKPIGDPSLYVDKEGNGYKSYTRIITDGMLAKLPEQFFVSLFQGRIKAEFEIRSFYLDGYFRSTAIMGSVTTDIKLSVRMSHATQFVKYKLPSDVEQKLHVTMKELNLNSASIDIMKGEDGHYYFLEANPVGQFSGYGMPCNYHLEKMVAEWLIKNDTPLNENNYEQHINIRQELPHYQHF
jgi:ATP-GRASP peptide maturase of grasp-with-spasm system